MFSEQELSCAYGARVTSLLLVQKRSNQEKMTPRLALAGRRATASALPLLRHSCRRLPCRRGVAFFGNAPLRSLSTSPHRRARDPGRGAGHRGPHYSEEPQSTKRQCIQERYSLTKSKKRLNRTALTICHRPEIGPTKHSRGNHQCAEPQFEPATALANKDLHTSIMDDMMSTSAK